MLAISKRSFSLFNRFSFVEGKVGQSFYRRELPQNLTVLDSKEGKEIFKQGLIEGHCESFFTLVQQFITQNDVSTCSTASLAMTLNALKVDPGVNWKGIWRWYDDYNIKHLDPDKIISGLTLEEFHQLAQHNSVRSMAFSPLQGITDGKGTALRQSSLEMFRACVKACTSRNDGLLTANFHRKTLGQTGLGHYSPIGAYNMKRDLVLILDVAKFKYDSYWCKLESLYESMKPLDTTSQLSRGFLINKTLVREQQDIQMHATNEEQFPQQTTPLSTLSNQQIYGFIDELGIQLNKEEEHDKLIHLLYDYATADIENSAKLLFETTQALGIEESHIQVLLQSLTPSTRVLLEAFKHTGIQDVLKMLIVAMARRFKRSAAQKKSSQFLQFQQLRTHLQSYGFLPSVAPVQQ